MSIVDAPASASRARQPARRPWLLLFNCQAEGLASCLTLLSDRIDVEWHDTLTIDRERERLLAELDRYDKVLVAPAIEQLFQLNFGERDNVIRLPNLHFGAYHPDACVLAQEGPLSTGPLGLFHSALAHAGFRAGLDEADTLALFNARSYTALGYFDRWAAARDSVVAYFHDAGYRVGEHFVRWSRSGPFMHTPNRPKIECLLDLARMALERAGLPAAVTDVVPPDNLAYGPVYPVYPEIGATIGVRGSYHFKEEMRSGLLDLPQYIAECFALYRSCSGVEPDWPAFRPVIDNAIAYVKSLR